MTEHKELIISSNLDNLIANYKSKMEELYEEKNPGQIRSKKGALVEKIAKDLARIAWVDYLEQPESRLNPEPNKKKFKLKVAEIGTYLTRYCDLPIAEKIKSKKDSIFYNFGTDVHVYIDKELVLAIECKSYTENAMFKRLIYDRKLLNEKYPDATYVLLQLESALGGDFDSCSKALFGSNQYHFFMSREETNIEVITLLEGRRDASKPIHRRENKKELKKEHLFYAVEVLARILEKYK